jgi:(p)ppGpp synthase/HD superfamily hydrolase
MAGWRRAFCEDPDLGTDDRVNGPVPIPALEDAIALAAHAHRGQIYPSPSDEPFILHPLRVQELRRAVARLRHKRHIIHACIQQTGYL